MPSTAIADEPPPSRFIASTAPVDGIDAWLVAGRAQAVCSVLRPLLRTEFGHGGLTGEPHQTDLTFG
jgi:hypothetical protein